MGGHFRLNKFVLVFLMAILVINYGHKVLTLFLVIKIQICWKKVQRKFLLGFLILKVNKIKCFILNAMNIDGDNLDSGH